MIRKMIILCMLLTLMPIPFSEVGHMASAQKPVPDYAKWGVLAMQQTRSKYPMAQIIDYLHVGREDMKNGTSTERFKLWLRQGNKEFGVFVTITFDTKTEEVKNVLFIETDR